jgi:putative DNA primase/helicase
MTDTTTDPTVEAHRQRARELIEAAEAAGVVTGTPEDKEAAIDYWTFLQMQKEEDNRSEREKAVAEQVEWLAVREEAKRQYAEQSATAFDPGTLAGGRLLDRDELALIPPIRPFIEGVMKRPSACVLVAPYGSFKSFLALSWALCSATGKQWLGRKVEKAKVLFVVGEGGSGLDARIRAWEAAFNGGQRVPKEDFRTLVAPASLTDPATWAAITAFCVEHGIGFVILDTLSSLASDADETKDSAPIMRHLSDLASAIDGPALLVHHPGHSDHKRTRGGYQFEGNADEVFLMARASKGSPLVSLTMKKEKDDEDGNVIWLQAEKVMELTADEDMTVISLVLKEAGAQDATVPMADRLLTLLAGAEEEGITPRQARVSLGLSPDDRSNSTFGDARKSLADKGLLVAVGKGTSTRYFHTDHAPIFD